MSAGAEIAASWQDAVFGVLKEFEVRQVAYVPDAGHTRLIERAHAEPAMVPVVLTTEEEGVALAAGAWLGGERSVLLMQSSGVGNCVNMFSLIGLCRFPFLTLVTMRGEWGEFNPWQIPMGRAAPQAFELMGVRTMRAERPEEAAETVRAAAVIAYEAESAVAVLLSQRLIGA
ncbi:MAG: phosphonopyruvate decarboxylase, partial [Microvirga sp.]